MTRARVARRRHGLVAADSLWVSAALVCLLVAVGVVTAPLARANLLTDGSFETPIVPATSQCGPYADCLGFSLQNSDLGGWTVVGKGGVASTILLLGSNYIEPDHGDGKTLRFLPADGSQAVDLTGEGNQGTTNGIKQTVTTIVGQTYALTFDVGHQWDHAPGYAGASSVSLWLDGTEMQVYSNSADTPENVTWEQFTFTFSAPTDQTTIAFLNATPVGNNFAGLDGVVLNAVSEASTLAVFAGGLGLLSVLTWRKRRTTRAERAI